METPDARPADGLLTDPDLQQVVELQVRRDGAALVERLSSPRAAVRARAALALGSVQDPAAVPALIQALADSSTAVRRDVAFALGQAGDTTAFRPMLQAFGSERDGEVRHRLLEAMGKVPALGAPSALIQLEVRPDEEPARTLAVARLGAVKGIIPDDAVVWLLGHLTDPNPAVRKHAAYFIGRVHTAAPWTDRSSIVRDALASYRKDDPAAMYLLQGLGRHAEGMDAPVLEEWIKSATDWRSRANAAAGLGAWEGEEEATELLVRTLDDPSIHVAVSAARSISARPPRPTDPPKVEAWIDAHPDRWQVVAPLLTFLARADDREYVFKWFDALPADDAVRRRIGLDALVDVGGQEAMDRLTKALDDPSPAVAAEAAVALARRWRIEGPILGDVATYFGLLSSALRQGRLRAVFAVAPTLADSVFVKMGSVDTLTAAYRRMSAPDDIDAMTTVLSALTDTGDPAVAGLLRGAARDADPVIRRAAAADLERLTGDTIQVAAEPDAAPAAGAPIPDPAKLDWSYLGQLGDAPRLVLETAKGTVVVRLDTDEAPQTVQTIARLAEAGKYDGTPFHRVVPNFVIQGGDFTNKDGSGGAGFTIDSEFTLIPFVRGVIGMASSGKDTEGSQFFITHSMQPHLDGAYTAFGWVVKGMDVVDRIAQGDTIVRASIERGGD